MAAREHPQGGQERMVGGWELPVARWMPTGTWSRPCAVPAPACLSPTRPHGQQEAFGRKSEHKTDEQPHPLQQPTCSSGVRDEQVRERAELRATQ